MNHCLERVVPLGFAPTRSWTWGVGSYQVLLAAFVSHESKPSRWETSGESIGLLWVRETYFCMSEL